MREKNELGWATFHGVFTDLAGVSNTYVHTELKKSLKEEKIYKSKKGNILMCKQTYVKTESRDLPALQTIWLKEQPHLKCDSINFKSVYILQTTILFIRVLV